MTVDYGAQLTSRFCHDLANPLGAIGNGIELLTMTGLPASPELALVQESLHQANAKLKLFRLAFGTAAAADATVKETEKFLQTWNNASRVQVTSEPDLSLTPAQAQLCALCNLCLENALPSGGMIHISQGHAGMQISGAGPRLMVDDGLWAYVQSPHTKAAEVPAARMHFITAGAVALHMGLVIQIRQDGDQITLTMS